MTALEAGAGRAASAPIPRAAPEISTTLPSRRFIA
jgi:hypothetical protein